MKRILGLILAFAAVASMGCWEDGGGAGGGSIIITPHARLRLDGRTVTNGLIVALPAQLDIQINTPDVDQATLQIRGGTSGEWITVRVVSGVECTFSSIYRPIFGRDTFTLALVGSGTTWQFRVQLVSGLVQNFPLSDADSGAYTVTTAINRRPTWE